MRPLIRVWFEEARVAEISFDGHPEPYGVGWNQMPYLDNRANVEGPERLFTFVN